MGPRTQNTAFKLPAPSVVLAARVERALRALRLGWLPWARTLTESAKRWWLRHHRIAEQPTTTVEMSGVRLAIPSSIVTNLLDRRFDPLTFERVQRTLRPGMAMVDVGAHVGAYTLWGARCVGPQGKVWACEPVPTNLAQLRRNVEQAGVSQVVVLPYAAGPREESREFHITAASGTHGFYHHPDHVTVSVEMIRQRPLDAMVTGPVDLVKIDVEGAELEVLAGMSRILRENRRISMVLEWNPSCMRMAGHDPASLPEILRGHGFTLTVLDEFEGRVKQVEDVLPLVTSGTAPSGWFVNLWAERAL